MMEKYGAEVERYEVTEVVGFETEKRKVIASNLTLDEALVAVEKNKNYMITPMR